MTPNQDIPPLHRIADVTSAAAVVAWLRLAVGLVAGVLLAMYGDVGVSLRGLAAWTAVGVGLAVFLSVVPRVGRDSPAVERALPVLTAVALLTSLVQVTGTVAVSGGLAGPMWVLFIPALLYTGMAVPRASLAFGVVSAGCVAIAGAVSHTLTGNAIGLLVVAAVLFPALSWYGSRMAQIMQRLRNAAGAERDSLQQHVQALSGSLERAARGDLSVRAEDSEDEQLRSLTAAFNGTVGNLEELVAQVSAGGEQIGSAAAALLATAKEHAASASQQSSAVSQTTATIEELAATARQIAETSEAVAWIATETLRNAEQGRSAVSASVESMDQIADRVEGIATRALSLGEKSHEIGRILDVIDDLADQTNLLALNAAIEAARAGEHGRGFAVVASEVRKLAERSQESAQQIQAIVGEIQAETNATIIASEEGAKEVKAGTQLARGVVDALERISSMVDETTTAAKEISIATQQQRSASDQVVAAMTQVSDVARQYAVGSRQSAAAAAQLNDLSAELESSISRFKVG